MIVKFVFDFQKKTWKKFNHYYKKPYLKKKQNENGKQKWKESYIIVRIFANMLRIPIKT
jgi:hypothetical protein